MNDEDICPEVINDKPQEQPMTPDDKDLKLKECPFCKDNLVKRENEGGGVWYEHKDREPDWRPTYRTNADPKSEKKCLLSNFILDSEEIERWNIRPSASPEGEKKALSVEEIFKIILDHGGIDTGNPNADSRICAQAIHSALPAQREVRYPEKDYCGKRNTALHKDNCEECKYHKLRNKLIDEFKKLNGG